MPVLLRRVVWLLAILFCVVFHFLCRASMVCRGRGSLRLGCASCSKAEGSYSVCMSRGVCRLGAVLCCVVCGFVFGVCRLGFRAIHLPVFAFELFVAEYDFDVWERACFLCVFDPFNYIASWPPYWPFSLLWFGRSFCWFCRCRVLW